jgi:hypothetical protein
MEVFILSRGNAYDGYEIEGVYTSEDQARKEAARRLKVEDEVWRLEAWEADGECKWVKFLDQEEDE